MVELIKLIDIFKYSILILTFSISYGQDPPLYIKIHKENKFQKDSIVYQVYNNSSNLIYFRVALQKKVGNSWIDVGNDILAKNSLSKTKVVAKIEVDNYDVFVFYPVQYFKKSSSKRGTFRIITYSGSTYNNLVQKTSSEPFKLE